MQLVLESFVVLTLLAGCSSADSPNKNHVKGLRAGIKHRGPLKAEEPLKLYWQISNESRDTLYVYSTYLKTRRFYFSEVDTTNRKITVRLAAHDVSPILPYASAPLKLLTLKSAENAQGEITSYTFEELLTGVGKSKEIAHGVWHIRAVIGYGKDENAVKTAFNELGKVGAEDPTNAVARWQSLAYSDFIDVDVESRVAVAADKATTGLKRKHGQAYKLAR